MAQSAKLQPRQSQGLTLTPQLLQSINLLQLSAVELSSFVQKEIEKNPLLELNTLTDDTSWDRSGTTAGKDSSDTLMGITPQDMDGRSFDTRTNPMRPSGANQSGQLGQGSLGVGSHTGGPGFSGDSGGLETFVASQQSFRDFLLQQASLNFRAAEDLRIAKDIIDLIDSDGYLRDDLSSVCRLRETDMSAVLGVLEQVQKFDPLGVGARNLAECMRLQLAEKNRLDPAMQVFTENLELLAAKKFQELARLCGVDHEDLLDMVQELRDLEPYPGNAFDPAPVQNAIPDVFVTAGNDDSWQIELNTQTLPKVLVNHEYYSEIKGLGLEKTDKKFMVDNLQSANWLVTSLDQRARTILKVATEIVKQQNMFFKKGEQFLKPLKLKEVAKEIGMHESTISRVTRNKFLTCDRGIYEFKYFFMAGVAGKDGQAGFGAQSIRLKIRNLILSETKDCVLSDDKISGLLSKDGIKIARRTVAKYRESMGFQSSIERAREKNAFAGQ